MVRLQSTTSKPSSLETLTAIFANLHDGRLLAQLWLLRFNGRHGYPIRSLWRAYVASFYLNLDSVNALIRRLQADKDLRKLCGFDRTLPHRTTFNRFIGRLSRHPELVEESFDGLTEWLRLLLPDLGEYVAIDSTTVRVHANPNRKHKVDPEAGWTKKNSARAKEGGKEWHYGYKLHLVVDAVHGLPLAMKVTPANVNDSPELPPVMDKARQVFPWFQPKATMADRGYDAMSNYAYLHDQGSVPVILNRRNPRNALHDDIFTTQGVPTCVGAVPMRYVRTDEATGHRLYECVGCHLAKRTGVRYCDDSLWVDPGRNLRLFGVLRRDSPEWKEFYAKRQAVERTFKSLKQSRRLERHYVRGLRQVRLHCYMAVLVYQVTALVTLLGGEAEFFRWMVAKVA